MQHIIKYLHGEPLYGHTDFKIACCKMNQQWSMQHGLGEGAVTREKDTVARAMQLVAHFRSPRTLTSGSFTAI